MDKLINFHLDSFNYCIGEGLKHAVENATVQKSHLKEKIRVPNYPLLPNECHLRMITYSANLHVSLKFTSKNIGFVQTERVFLVPAMVKSSVCLLHDHLEKAKEDEHDLGGYFIVNGKERLFRMFLVQRRNYPMAIIRKSWHKKIYNLPFTKYGVHMHCVALDESSSDISLRFLDDFDVSVSFQHNGYKQYVSFMALVKSLGCDNDDEIYKNICTDATDTLAKTCVGNMLSDLKQEGIITQMHAKTALGQHFQNFVPLNCPLKIADVILSECIFIHLQENKDKVNLFFYMVKKLFSLIHGKCQADDPYKFCNQEILLGSHTYLILLKFELKNYLAAVKSLLKKKLERGMSFSETTAQSCTKKAPYVHHLCSALSTGNLPLKLGLKQSTGASVLCERTNYFQFLSNFTKVQKFIFSQYSSTSIRFLQPEYWGYLCPVQTSTGETTGLVNHLTKDSVLTTSVTSSDRLVDAVKVFCSDYKSHLERTDVLINGKICGKVPTRNAQELVLQLRLIRNQFKELEFVEIVLLTDTDNTFYPGVFIFTTAGRIMRPVKHLESGNSVYLGVLESSLQDIAISPEEIIQNVHQYIEHSPGTIVGTIASCIPFFECNPSPRNIYFCHMMKQALGIPLHSLPYRNDTKLYHYIYPQGPLVTTQQYEENSFNDYPIGTNAVIAVLSYSGYDMEDAIVINKSSLERGMANTVVFKTEIIDLQQFTKEMDLKIGRRALVFKRDDKWLGLENNLDLDGLPYPGLKLNQGDVYCCYMECETNKYHVKTYNLQEPCFVHDVKLLGNHESPLYLTKVSIKFRMSRPVEIGDKFVNRHGQKGIVSYLIPEEDLPFSADGTVPDILFNPHSFPGRMTVGMTIEAMAGLYSAETGEKTRVSAFQFSEKKSAAQCFSRKLLEVGYNMCGTAKLYSGVSGKELEADIFTGVVYYHRLRHMVHDKYQVRSVGERSFDFQQPVKCFSKDGAIRFGEMERDVLISHGSAYLLHDRLLIGSDLCKAYVCSSCHAVLCTVTEMSPSNINKKITCRSCAQSSIQYIYIPYAYLTLVSEFASMNIQVRCDFHQPANPLNCENFYPLDYT